jgi:hypothetical protein
MLSALALVLLFGGPGIVLLGCARARGAAPWPWPRGVAVALAFGVALAALTATACGAFRVYSLAAECAAVAGSTLAIAAVSGFRFAWPLARASLAESGGFVVVALASIVMLGHPFEMLLGERDATVYTVSGIGLAREGSLVLRDHTADLIGADAMRRFYPVPTDARRAPDAGLRRLPLMVKYPGFYYVDRDRREIVAQGLPLLPALIAIFYGGFGLGGAFVVNNAIGLLAVGSVFAAGTSLIGAPGAALAASLLALNAIEVWAARYPVAEILFQALLFAGLAAYLRGDRLGRGIAGFLLGATLLAKVEAALMWLPIGGFALVALARRHPGPGRSFWLAYGGTTSLAAAYWACFQADYAYKAYRMFSSLQSRLVGDYFAWRGSWIVAAMLLTTLLAVLGFMRRSRGAPHDLSRSVARGLAVGVVLFAGFGYWVRPHLVGLVAGQGQTFVWLSWYVSPGVLLLGFAGLAHYLWTRGDGENLFVLGILLTLASVFLHFTFVNLIHIYMTRRFVPAALPLVLLFFGHVVATLGASGKGRARAACRALALLVAAGAVSTIVRRALPLYDHSEYPGLAARFTDLATSLKGEDIVFLSDGTARNLLGPALEFAFGVKTLVVWPPAYDRERTLIRRWIDEGKSIGALTVKKPLEDVPGAEEFELIDQPVWWISALAQAENRFPTERLEDVTTLARYAAGRGSDPLYDLWKREGARIAGVVCGGVRLLGGDRFLLRRMRAVCPDSGVSGRTMGYLVGDAESAAWQAALEAYGARFVRRDLGGVVLFDEIAPQPSGPRLSPMEWTLEASDGPGSERLAVDGDLDTRWGSHAPQRPGMRFAIRFPRPTDVSWLKIRMGRFTSDRARRLVLETSVDGEHWNRRELPPVVDGIRWRDGVPAENADGDLDLWVNAPGIRALSLVSGGESSRFDWSIAELEIDGEAGS